MKNLLKKKLRESLILKYDKENNDLIVFSDEKDEKKASQETFRNKESLKKNNFRWDNKIKAWATPVSNFENAKRLLKSINKNDEFVNSVEELEEFVMNSESFDGKGDLMGKIKQYIEDLSNATDEKVVSAEMRRYFSFFAKFRGHSPFNTMLIYIQKPDATRVAGFRQWEAKFRRVKKGAKGIMIFVPIFPKKNEKEADSDFDSDTKGPSPVRFKGGYVFDISDTEPIDDRGHIPEQPKWFTELPPNEITEKLYDVLLEIIDNVGIKITNDPSKRGEKGTSMGGHINMTSNVKGAGEVSTLVHEFAHELMHWKKSSIFYQGDDARRVPEIMELQAESVAYIVMKYYGLPVDHQPTYLALWKANKEKIIANIKALSDVANFIISEMDKLVDRTQMNEEIYRYN